MLDVIKEQLNKLSKGQLITLLVGCVLVLVLAMYYLYNCIKSDQVEYFDDHDEHDEMEGLDLEEFSNNNVIIRMFYVDWCGYCKKAKPGYMQFMKQYNDTQIIITTPYPGLQSHHPIIHPDEPFPALHLSEDAWQPF